MTDDVLKKNTICVVMMIVGVILIIKGFNTINDPVHGAVSEFSVLRACSTGLLLGIGGFIITTKAVSKLFLK